MAISCETVADSRGGDAGECPTLVEVRVDPACQVIAVMAADSGRKWCFCLGAELIVGGIGALA